MRSSAFVRFTVLVLLIAAGAAALYGRGRSSSVRSGMSPQPIAGGSFEASGVVYVPGSRGVLFVDDQEGRAVYWMEIADDGTQAQPARPIPLGVEIVDPEGLTTDGTHVFMVGSQSKGGGSGASLARFRFDAERRTVRGVETISGLKTFLSEHVRELRDQGAVDALNIEGLGWDPGGNRLLLGLREPVVDGQALVVPLAFRDPGGPLALENLEIPGGRALLLGAGGAGIRSLEYDDRARAFRVITGPAQDGTSTDFRLIEWSGGSASELRPLATFPRALKAEGITRAVIGGRPRSLVVFDAGQFVVVD